MEDIISDTESLLALYGHGNEPSLIKEIDFIHPHYRAFIEQSPYLVIASSGPTGVDASPRGDPAGFVKVLDDKTLLIPDRRGNNRVDTLHNIVLDPRVGLLFLIPGVGESLRANGTACISIKPSLLAQFAHDHKPARSVLVVTIETIYFQCPRAAVRSALWDPAHFIQRSDLPSTGTILSDFSKRQIDGKEWDRTREETVNATLY